MEFWGVDLPSADSGELGYVKSNTPGLNEPMHGSDHWPIHFCCVIPACLPCVGRCVTTDPCESCRKRPRQWNRGTTEMFPTVVLAKVYVSRLQRAVHQHQHQTRESTYFPLCPTTKYNTAAATCEASSCCRRPHLRSPFSPFFFPIFPFLRLIVCAR